MLALSEKALPSDQPTTGGPKITNHKWVTENELLAK
jgi:hypothetical protein